MSELLTSEPLLLPLYNDMDVPRKVPALVSQYYAKDWLCGNLQVLFQRNIAFV